MKNQEILEALLNLKSQYYKAHKGLDKLKTEKGVKKRREKILGIRRQFADVIYDYSDQIEKMIEKCFDKNKNSFCVMAMVGGPYYTGESTYLGVYKVVHGGFQVILDDCVGTLSFIDDKCGIDNLKSLYNIYKS